MIDAKHTPGPWDYNADMNSIEVQGSFLATVATVNDFPCLDPEEHDIKALEKEYEANARLIAAAPELLAACEAFRTLFRNSDMRPEDECHELFGMMGDAIEKATGQRY